MITMREFVREYLFKVLLILVVIEIGIFAYLQSRNHKPVAVPDNTEVFARQEVEINALRNDTDKEEADLTIKSVSTPFHGEVKIVDNKLVYSPTVSETLRDSFTYKAFDGKKASKEAWVVVQVNENQAPETQADEFIFYPQSEMELAVLGNDNDREGDTTYIKEFTNPLFGLLEQQGDILVYKPNSQYAVTDSFQYSTTDGYTESELTTVVISVRDKSHPCYPWLSSDIGSPALAGGLICSAGKYTIQASGNDIWNNSDNFHFVFQTMDGDGQIVAKVHSIENTNQWAKAGVMIRESLAANSKNTFVLISSESGALMQSRDEPGASTNMVNRMQEIRAPYWVKLVRKGNSLTGLNSADGVNWTEHSTITLEMSQKVYVGLAVTSHNNGQLTTAEISNVRLKK